MIEKKKEPKDTEKEKLTLRDAIKTYILILGLFHYLLLIT